MIMIIVTVIAALVLLSAAVAMLVVKTGASPNWKKVGKVLGWTVGVIVLVVVCVSAWNHVPSKYVNKSPKQEHAKSEIKENKPVEEWIFTWRLPPGQIDHVVRKNRNTLSVQITKNNSEVLWVVLHEMKNGADVAVGGLRLGKIGNDLIGTWSNYLDGDGGGCYLYKDTEFSWSGHYELKDGSRTDCNLKRK